MSMSGCGNCSAYNRDMNNYNYSYISYYDAPYEPWNTPVVLAPVKKKLNNHS
jgi:hypothetical protein